MQEIEQIFRFIVELDKLKEVYRKTKSIGSKRYENAAEHSWQVCLTALALREYGCQSIDINKVILMLLIHDIGEIDAGDTIIYESETIERYQQEKAGVKRVLSLLPEQQANDYFKLWQEFEEATTPEAVFARAVDRIPPVLHNLFGDQHSWRTHNIAKEQVFEINQRVGEASTELWDYLRGQIEEAFKKIESSP